MITAKRNFHLSKTVLVDTAEVHEESEIKTSIDKNTIVNDFGEGEDIDKDLGPNYSVQSLKLQSVEKNEKSHELEKSLECRRQFSERTWE